MNDIVIESLERELKITKAQIKNVLSMLSEGATIPFIARYRKEKTGGLDEDQIRTIEQAYKYQVNLYERKLDVIRLIEEKDLLTDELKNNILACEKLAEVEDIYRPFKEKKKTKATEAINNGLEPLAKMIMAFPTKGDLDSLTTNFINDKVKSAKDALEGASYIIAEWISDNSYYRKWIRNNVYHTGFITSKIKKGVTDEAKTFERYYDFKEAIKSIKHYRVLAINRGEDKKVLTVNIEYDLDEIINYLESKIIKNSASFVTPLVKESIKDSLKRLIMPSIERELRSELTDNSEVKAIDTFSKNLEHLLLTRPIKGQIVLGFDPGYVNGCKIAVVDESGKYLDSVVVKPFLNSNQEKNIVDSKKIVANLVNKYHVNIISIGNGTASRESEKLVSEMIKEFNLDCKYVITSEAGASVYSASKLAIEEFPNLEVEKRSAVSIGRRIQDPLSELVKIDPKSIGVGEYQYDVNQKNLSEALDFTTSKIVNEVGVNINTASKSILKYISGLTAKAIDALYTYKETKHIDNRDEIKKIKGITPKIYEQAIGFLRINDGNNPLDKTGIHPESYGITNEFLKQINLNIKDINTKEFKESLKNIDVNKYVNSLNTDIYTLEDIKKELLNPGLDPRDNLEQPLLKSNVLTIDDLTCGMKLQGTVRNVASFGAFVDIGLHDDGLIHISKLSKNFVKDPLDIVNVGDIIECTVLKIDKISKKVELSLID